MITVLLLYGGRFGEGYAVANDLEQAQSRVFEMCRRIVQASPLLRAEAKIGVDRITFPAIGTTITALASDFASSAGGHPTVSTFDELWGFASERARRLFDELVPVPTRQISCRLTVTYAGFEGESELLHELYRRGLAQPEIAPGLHAGDGMLMFWTHQPVAPWQDEKWLAQMRRSLRPNQYLRMIENRFVTTESAFIDLEEWDRCVDPDATPMLANPSLPVWIGVDASVKHDSTAVAVVTFDRQAQRVILVSHRIFQPSAKEPLDFEATIARTVRELMKRFAVRGVFYDPFQMAAVAQRLRAAGVPMREFPQTVGNLTEIASNLYELVKTRAIVAYPDADIRLAISRAIAIETGRGWRITKEKASHRIDIVVALAMAAHAAVYGSREPEVSLSMPFVAGAPRAVAGGSSLGYADAFVAPTPNSLTAPPPDMPSPPAPSRPGPPPRSRATVDGKAAPPDSKVPPGNWGTVNGDESKRRMASVNNDRSLEFKIMSEPSRVSGEPQPSLGSESWRFPNEARRIQQWLIVS
jgi:hypothetical protein